MAHVEEKIESLTFWSGSDWKPAASGFSRMSKSLKAAIRLISLFFFFSLTPKFCLLLLVTSARLSISTVLLFFAAHLSRGFPLLTAARESGRFLFLFFSRRQHRCSHERLALQSFIILPKFAREAAAHLFLPGFVSTLSDV